MRYRRSRSMRNYRVTEAQRSAAEDTYLNSLRNPSPQYPQVTIPVHGRGKRPKDYHPKNSRKKKTQISQPTYLVASTTRKDNSAWIALLIVLAIIAVILAAAAFSPSRDQRQQYSSPVVEPVAPSKQSCSIQDCSSGSPDFSVSHSGNGYTVECNDGTYSSSGGRRGTCSYHGGEIIHSSKIHIYKK